MQSQNEREKEETIKGNKNEVQSDSEPEMTRDNLSGASHENIQLNREGEARKFF